MGFIFRMMSDDELIKNMWCEGLGPPGGLCNFRARFYPHERASDMGEISGLGRDHSGVDIATN